MSRTFNSTVFFLSLFFGAFLLYAEGSVTMRSFPTLTSSKNAVQYTDFNNCFNFSVANPIKKEFYSPNYPDIYPNNVKCTLWIVAPPGHTVKLDFRDKFHLEHQSSCDFDWLEVRDGPYDYSPMIGTRLCGSGLPEQMISSNRYMWLQFTSDEGDQYEGFRAVYDFVKMPNQSTSSPDIEKVNIQTLKHQFLRRRKSGSTTDRWGSQVHRIAVALHLADNSTFGNGNSTGEEIRYELTVRLMERLAKDKKMSSQELALYIHALLVACMDPRDFHGDDLVRELRRRVDEGGNCTNPFLILALCNAGDAMTARDVERVTAAYDSQHRPFWTDFQALASMALSCISSCSGVSVDERTLKDMLQELKRRQFRNGTVDNFRTTALVTQALFIHDSYKKDFDLESAMKVIIDGVNRTRSLLDTYFAIPAFVHKSLLNISSSHCRKEPVAEEDALQKVLDLKGETITVQYSIWMGDEINLSRTWRVKMRINSTIYSAMETVAKIDNRQKVEYNVVDGKPFVSALQGKEDDPEMGTLWFVYLRNLSSDEKPKIVEESPVDVKLRHNQEIILWYKRAPWNAQNVIQNSVTSSLKDF